VFVGVVHLQGDVLAAGAWCLGPTSTLTLESLRGVARRASVRRVSFVVTRTRRFRRLGGE